MKKVEIAIVKGSEGFSLQIYGKHGGLRFDGPKAWVIQQINQQLHLLLI